ncbi:MAG: DUF1697 domain-containing protein [Sphingomicrobium sp.]
MTAFVALLRAVNVGGRPLIMTELKCVAEELGFGSPRTFIASGNLLFTSPKPEAAVKTMTEAAVEQHMAKPIAVMVRSAREMAAVVKGNPFAAEPGNKVVSIFLNDPPSRDAIAGARNLADERMALGTREIYVHYPSGQGVSKLRIPAAEKGTVRNMNTVAKLAELARGLQ